MAQSLVGDGFKDTFTGTNRLLVSHLGLLHSVFVPPFRLYVPRRLGEEWRGEEEAFLFIEEQCCA